jgi:hypothetical protein
LPNAQPASIVIRGYVRSPASSRETGRRSIARRCAARPAQIEKVLFSGEINPAG